MQTLLTPLLPFRTSSSSLPKTLPDAATHPRAPRVIQKDYKRNEDSMLPGYLHHMLEYIMCVAGPGLWQVEDGGSVFRVTARPLPPGISPARC